MDYGLLAGSAVILGGVWVASQALLNASAFVNALRETVVIGRKEGRKLSVPHLRVLKNDWLFTMIGSVAFPLVYGISLLAIGLLLAPSNGIAPRVIVGLLASVPIIGSMLFVACGIGDWKLMSAAVTAAEARERARKRVA